MVELQKAKDQNERLDGEIHVLRERVRSLDNEKKSLLEKVSVHHTLKHALISLAGKMLDAWFYS